MDFCTRPTLLVILLYKIYVDKIVIDEMINNVRKIATFMCLFYSDFS